MKTLALLALLAFVYLYSANATQDRLVVGTFGIAYIDRFAINKGYFAEKNLNVTFSFVQGSEQQFNSLDDGSYDLASTTGDNVIYRRLNQGKTEYTVVAEYSTASGIWLLGNSNLGINSIEDLDGKTIITDSTQSGFIVPGHKLYKEAGIPLPDSLMIFVGSLNQRITLLANGQTNATMSNAVTSYTATYKNPQITILGDILDWVCPYIGSELVVRQNWLQDSANQDKLIRYIRAELKALAYITDPANKAEVISFIIGNEGVDEATANRIFDDTIASPNSGFNQYMVPRMDAITNAVNLRVQDLRITRAACIPLAGELASQSNGWIDVSFLNTAAGQELGFWNVYGLYYSYPSSPCA